MIDEDVLKTFAFKKCLITGGTGLIGRQVAELLHEAQANVTVCSLDKIVINSTITHIYCDLSNFSLCKDLTKEMDYVFHLAGVKGSAKVTKTKPASFFVPLLMMNTNVLEACRINSVEKVVYTSSVGAYPNTEVFKEVDSNFSQPPMDTYPGWAKRMAEMQIQAYQIQYGLKNYAIVRPTNVYGPGDNFDSSNAMVIPSLMTRIASREDPLVVWGDGSAIRDFAYSKDVAEGIIQALYYGTNFGFVNLGSGKGCSIKELVETLAEFLDFNYEFDVSKPSGFPIRIMDIVKAKQMINYNPSTSLKEGLELTWKWFLKHRNEHLNKKNYFNE